MRLLFFAVAVALVVAGISTSAAAEDAAAGYRARLMISGYLLRAGMACGGKEAKSTIGTAARYGSSGDLVQFNKAFPKQLEAWMREGAGHFNEEVMSRGMTATCSAARSLARAAP